MPVPQSQFSQPKMDHATVLVPTAPSQLSNAESPPPYPGVGFLVCPAPPLTEYDMTIRADYDRHLTDDTCDTSINCDDGTCDGSD